MGSFAEKVEQAFERIGQEGLAPVWISLVDRENALKRVRDLDRLLPLYGQIFAVKDNIDVAGMPTTAACPTFSYVPSSTAAVVTKLEAAGAILIGKTNMDQFATGLVGTRTPYGICSSVFNPAYISGGSSSGSAVAVAKGLVDFSLGTDTAGSGRVPAALNNVVGLKPTKGAIRTDGVVPACRTLDCVSIFAKTCAEADAVYRAVREPVLSGRGAAPWSGGPFRFGVPREDQLKFFGDSEGPGLYARAVVDLQTRGGEPVEIDFGPFRAAAELLYSGPWVAERLAAVGSFLSEHGDQMDATVRSIIGGAARYSAADMFRAIYRLEELRKQTDRVWESIDVLFLPTVGRTYTIADVQADPLALNTNLGYYTNFVNLLDLAAVAVPAGFRSDGLPFGVSFIGRAFTDRALLALGGTLPDFAPPECIAVAVVGAHLSGQPLNRQLVSRGARLMKTTRSSADYRLYALKNTVPPKPGLVREPGFAGPGIELEVWWVPSDRFGSFVAEIPAPLGIGTVVLEDGTAVKGFICETAALAESTDITRFGGWRNYLARTLLPGIEHPN